MNINLILQLPAKTKVDGLAGTIKKAFKRSTGGSGDKLWSVQNLVVTDSTGEITVSVWNRNPIENAEGQPIRIAAKHSDKHGMVGVQREDNEYNGKVDKRLKVSESADMVIGSAMERQAAPAAERHQPAPAPAPAHHHQPAPAPAPAPAPDPTAGEPATDREILRGCVEAAKRTAQLGNAYVIALDRAMKVSDWYCAKYGEPLDERVLGGMTTTMVLELCRGGFIGRLPDKAHVGDYLKSLRPDITMGQGSHAAPEPAPVAQGAPTPAVDEDDNVPF